MNPARDANTYYLPFFFCSRISSNSPKKLFVRCVIMKCVVTFDATPDNANQMKSVVDKLAEIAVDFALTQDILIIFHAIHDRRTYHSMLSTLESSGILPKSHMDLIMGLGSETFNAHGNYIRVEDPCVIFLEGSASLVTALHELFHLYFDTSETGIKMFVEFYCEILALMHSGIAQEKDFDHETFFHKNQLLPDQFLHETGEFMEMFAENNRSILKTSVDPKAAYFQRYLAAWRFFKPLELQYFITPWNEFMETLKAIASKEAIFMNEMKAVLVDAPDVDDRIKIETGLAAKYQVYLESSYQDEG